MGDDMDLRTITVCNSGRSGSLAVEICNCLDGKYENNMAQEIRDGLMASPKYIPCKYFYDASGSKLFEDICRLPEY
jgi:uncharacterized SAM-dependent methyltransferase